jgi:ATP phosphoribosyltransferase regulatory subunit
MRASGRAEKAFAALMKIDLPKKAIAERDRLAHVLTHVKIAAPKLMLTLDPVERLGYEYQTGLSFTFFAKFVRGELGRGGRYLVHGSGEVATGFSLYLDSVLRAVGPAEEEKRLYIPNITLPEDVKKLHQKGWITVAALGDETKAQARDQAVSLGCSHIWSGQDAVAV